MESLGSQAPRLCMVAATETASEACLKRIARLHFNGIEIGLRVESQATENFDALATLSTRASKLGLNLWLRVDFSSFGNERRASCVFSRINSLARLVHGIRATGAHRLRPERWQEIIGAAPSLVWIADTLGADEDTTEHILKAGFGFYLGSTKWWNTKDAWALTQHERFRPYARSIGFPENLRGDRLIVELARAGITEPQAVKAYYGVRYALSAFFGTGLLMPLGYEVAATQSAVVPEKASDDDGRRMSKIDLCSTVTAINCIKAIHPYLEADLVQRRLPIDDALVLVGLDRDLPACCFVCNVSSQGTAIAIGEVTSRIGLDLAHLRDVTPGKLPGTIQRQLWLDPFDWRVFSRPVVVDGAASGSLSRTRRVLRSSNARIVIESVSPEIDAGRYPIKRIVGDRLEVSADIYRDGHETCAAALLVRTAKQSKWTVTPMQLHENDRWIGSILLTENCRYFYTIEAWRDPYASWLNSTTAKYYAGQDISLELTEGRELIATAAKRAAGRARRVLTGAAGPVANDELVARQIERLCAAEVQSCMAIWGAQVDMTRYRRELEVVVDRSAARFGAWYEMFPRSQGKRKGQGATFADCIGRLDDIAAMGFDVVYLPPIHPIGATNRKGRNNAVLAKPGDPGSPYAIGSNRGGHDAIEPELGTLEEFRAFLQACRQRGMEIALDFAVQCSPDHPWIVEHPEWFEFRSDGSIRFAENPPKKYQDIVNLNLSADGPLELWRALRDIVRFWIGQGVAIFRVDNPHTKPFAFWEWLIRDIQRERPDVIFLAEAFTRPKPLRYLAKLGFTQSYTYFTWRNSKQELIDYFVELTQTEAAEYLRPQLFTNTPDILPTFLQKGGAGAFRIRVALAATLSSLFGIYSGFELCEARALPNSEEYLNSEKYEYKVWDWERPGNIKEYIAALNRARARHSAFQDWRNLTFLPCDGDLVIFFVKWSAAGDGHIFVAISLDPHGPQSTAIELPFDRLGIGEGETVAVENLMNGTKDNWIGRRQQISLDPQAPAFLFTIRHQIARPA